MPNRCRNCNRLRLECVPSNVFCAVDGAAGKKVHGAVAKQPAKARSMSEGESCRKAAKDILEDDKPAENQLTRRLSDMSEASSSERSLFHYYVARLSGLLVNAIGYDNPLQSLIVPRATSSQLLLHTICAVSALHRSHYSAGHDKTLDETRATGYYVRSLAALKELMPTISPTDHPMVQNALLSSVFLCKYEIIKDGVSSWRRHLDGIQSLSRLLDKESQGCSARSLDRFANSL